MSVTYESFFELPLKLPAGNKRCSLRQLIETYLSEDQVPYKVPFKNYVDKKGMEDNRQGVVEHFLNFRVNLTYSLTSFLEVRNSY